MPFIRPRIFYKKTKAPVCLLSNNVDSEGSSSCEEDVENNESSAAKKKKRVGCVVEEPIVFCEDTSESDSGDQSDNIEIVIQETDHSGSSASSPVLSLPSDMSSVNGSVHTSPEPPSVIKPVNKINNDGGRKLFQKRGKAAVKVVDRYASATSKPVQAKRNILGVLNQCVDKDVSKVQPVQKTISCNKGIGLSRTMQANILAARKRSLVQTNFPTKCSEQPKENAKGQHGFSKYLFGENFFATCLTVHVLCIL